MQAEKAGSGAGEPEVAALSPEARKRVEALEELQAKYVEQHNLWVAETKTLHRKFEDIYAEIFKRRHEIVAGKGVDPAGDVAGTASDCVWWG